MRFPPSLAAKVGRLGKPTLTVEYYGFGDPVDTQLPPADQVTDFQDLLRRAG